MKILLELVFIVVLVVVGWRQPYREHLARALGTAPMVATPAPTPRRAAPAATPNRDSSWMWKPKTLGH